MRIFFLVFFFGFSFLLEAQKETVICGTVSSPDTAFRPFSYSGIMIDEPDVFYSASVNTDGFYSRNFRQHTRVKLYTFYENYYKADTTFDTGDSDTIRINFLLYPKNYIFSAAAAARDISKGKLQIVTYDTAVYQRSLEFAYTKQFHFDYILQPEPKDYDFKDNLSAYNRAMRSHLDSINAEGWYKRLDQVEDSLQFLEADNYGKTHPADLNALVFPATILPGKMEKKIAEREEDYQRLFKSRGDTLDYTESFMLGKIDSSDDYSYIFEAQFWMMEHYRNMIPELIRRITNKKEVGLINTADLIINERIASGQLKFYGHGGWCPDDLFTVAGRANFLLREITGENFGYVSMYSTEADLKKLQNRWVWWLSQL